MPPILSIIIPVYNAEEYIKRCIDSILKQTYSNWELILIDDGSSDNSGVLCDEFSHKDSRIQVFHKANGGASSARNAGIEKAHGKYLCFIDADDYVTPLYLNELLEDMDKEQDIDLVIQGYYQICPNNKSINFIPEPHISYLSKDSQLFYSINRYFAPFSKLFRYDIIKKHHLHFDTNLIVAEDYDFLLRYLLHSQKLHVSNTANYYYYSNDGSLSSRIYSFEQEYNVYHNAYYLSAEFSHKYKHGEWFSFPSFLLSRTLMSNYLNVYNRKERMEHLNRFSKEELNNFSHNFKAETLFLKLVRFLFTHRNNYILDILLHWRINPKVE